MIVLALGLLLFLGTHSVRIHAEAWRAAQLERLGEKRWKGLYSLLSLAGFGLIVWGFGLARSEPILLWAPPTWTRHLAAVLTLPAFILLAAAYVPGTRLKAAVGHPMMLGTQVWALAHLAANGALAHALLFGTFLIWAVAGFVAAPRPCRGYALPGNWGWPRRAGSPDRLHRLDTLCRLRTSVADRNYAICMTCGVRRNQTPPSEIPRFRF